MPGYQAGDYHMQDYGEADDGYGDGWSSGGYYGGKGALQQRHYNGGRYGGGQAGYDYPPANASNRNQFYPPSAVGHKGAGYGNGRQRIPARSSWQQAEQVLPTAANQSG